MCNGRVSNPQQLMQLFAHSSQLTLNRILSRTFSWTLNRFCRRINLFMMLMTQLWLLLKSPSLIEIAQLVTDIRSNQKRMHLFRYFISKNIFFCGSRIRFLKQTFSLANNTCKFKIPMKCARQNNYYSTRFVQKVVWNWTQQMVSEEAVFLHEKS